LPKLVRLLWQPVLANNFQKSFPVTPRILQHPSHGGNHATACKRESLFRLSLASRCFFRLDISQILIIIVGHWVFPGYFGFCDFTVTISGILDRLARPF
jgi:hypothetical protein